LASFGKKDTVLYESTRHTDEDLQLRSSTAPLDLSVVNSHKALHDLGYIDCDYWLRMYSSASVVLIAHCVGVLYAAPPKCS
jgi:hypothetical protein